MSQPSQSTIRCSACGQPVAASIRTVIDVQSDPQGKSLLLSNRLNQVPCQICGTVNTVVTPILYHDATKEMLIAYVPMEVSAQLRQPEEKIIGDLMNELTRSLPKEQFKAYMFNPRRALTEQGLIDQILEADGITKEAIAEQRQRIEMIQRFLDAPDEAILVGLIRQYDAQIDEQFMQTMSLMAERIMADGRQDIAGRLVAVQRYMLEHTSYGKEIMMQEQEQRMLIQEVADALEALGEDADLADFRDLALSMGDSDAKLQALVGLARPVFDANFLTAFDQYIAAADASEQPALQSVRDRLAELTALIDQQSEQTLRASAQFLQMVINQQDPAGFLADNMEMIDDNYMMILSMNIQEAERRQDMDALARLKMVYEASVNLLQSQMSPELRFLNSLLGEEDAANRAQLISSQASAHGPMIFELLDAVEKMFQSQGQQAALQRLSLIRGELAQALS